jgi:hypothetical protein
VQVSAGAVVTVRPGSDGGHAPTPPLSSLVADGPFAAAPPSHLPVTTSAGKAQQHVRDTGWRGVLMEAAVERSRYAEDFRDGMLDALTDPLVMDAVLFEGGALSHFLQVRGPLLPDDERALANPPLTVVRCGSGSPAGS